MKISFRSKGKENPVNVLAGDHFNGGGHANAAGGMSELTVTETLDKLKNENLTLRNCLNKNVHGHQSAPNSDNQVSPGISYWTGKLSNLST